MAKNQKKGQRLGAEIVFEDEFGLSFSEPVSFTHRQVSPGNFHHGWTDDVGQDLQAAFRWLGQC